MKTVEVSESALESLKAMVEQLQSERDELLEALKDMNSGWKYIRDWHGDLYGVGWDRAQNKADSAIAKCTQTQSICDWQEKMPR